MTRAAHSPFFFIPPSAITDDAIIIEGPDARHLSVVRRAEAGDKLVASDGKGNAFDVVVTSVSSQLVEGRVVGHRRYEPPAPSLVVIQGLAKGYKVDLVIQKVVEIGVDEVVIFVAGRSVPRWDERKSAAMKQRWAGIAIEAAKQSHRVWLPRVVGPVGIDEAAEKLSACEVKVIADPKGDSTLKHALKRQPNPAAVAMVVGPEGGLTDQELAIFEAKGGSRVSLGGSILRTETGALVLASAVSYEYGLLGGAEKDDK